MKKAVLKAILFRWQCRGQNGEDFLPAEEDTMYILRLRDGEVKMSEVHQNNRHKYLYALDPNKYHFIDLDVINAPQDDYQECKE